MHNYRSDTFTTSYSNELDLCVLENYLFQCYLRYRRDICSNISIDNVSTGVHICLSSLWNQYKPKIIPHQWSNELRRHLSYLYSAQHLWKHCNTMKYFIYALQNNLLLEIQLNFISVVVCIYGFEWFATKDHFNLNIS